MIPGFVPQPATVLTRRESEIVREDNASSEGAKFHESEVLADAAHGTHGEGCEGVFVLDHFFLGEPALGYEAICRCVDGFVCEGTKRGQ